MHPHKKSAPSVRSPLADTVAHDKSIARLIHRKARQLVGIAGFTSSDEPDIRSELYLKLLQHIDKFDPKNGSWLSFAKTVIERQAANLIRDARAQKRNRRRVCSINVVIGTEDDQPIELSDTIGCREQDARLAVETRDEHELAQLIQDTRETIAGLPKDLSELAEARQSRPLAAIARDRGVHRTTLQKTVHVIRERFEQVGLKDYLTE